ncbi:MAG: Mrp/NBP35 family ATP-binding protein [Clostridia bacterium]|nr:Mrp/NBP35 family ATP-binding protein [Clostridia bacterium]
MSEPNQGSNNEKQSDHRYLEDTNALSNIKRVIAVISGKGGVGKTAVTALLATTMAKKGYKCAIIDADIRCGVLPKLFGVTDQIVGNANLMFPAETKSGIKMISSYLLIDEPAKPVLWKSSVAGGAVKQFWTDVKWGDVDYMFIDCPSGTGDVPLVVLQSIKIDGVIVVSTPQELASMIAVKAAEMAKLIGVPVFGFIENMSGTICPHCDGDISLYGKSSVPEIAKKYGLPVLAEIPHDISIAEAGDLGTFEELDVDYADPAVDKIERGLPTK